MIPCIDPTTLLVPVAVVGLCTVILVAYLRRHDISSSTVDISGSLPLSNHWIHLLKFTLSTSEQSNFEEEFKYLIVTSSLFNGTPQSEEQQRSTLTTLESTPAQGKVKQIRDFSSQSLTVSLVATNMAFVLIMNQFRSVLPPVLFCCADTMACYFILRHYKRVQIRKIHASALDSMHQNISLSQESDMLLNRLLKSSTLSSSNQHQLGSHLSFHFETFVDTVHQLQPLIDAHNLSRLRDMYSVNQDIPSTLLEFDSHQYKLEDIDLIYAVIGWKRREYLLYLLALDVMSNNRTARYGKIWRQAIHVNHNLVREYVEFNKKLSVISAELIDSTSEKTTHEDDEKISLATSAQSDTSSVNEGMSISDGRCITLMHRVSVVEKYMEDIQAKLFLCRQDTKSLTSGRVSSLSLKRINKRFSHIDENMANLLKQWEESKNSLQSLLQDDQSKLKTTFTSLPSPPSSPSDFRQNVYSADVAESPSLMAHVTKSRRYTTSL